MDKGYVCIPTHPPSPPPPLHTDFIFTVVGNGTAGYASNVQQDALDFAYDVTFDTLKLGNLLIVDDHNYALRRVEANGSIITITGNHSQGYSGDGGVPTSFEVSFTHAAAVDC
jgi:hypothetical protein